MNENEFLGCEKHAKDCGVTLTDTGLGEFNCTCNYGVANGLSILIEMRSEQKCYSRESRIELAALDIKRELDARTAPKSTLDESEDTRYPDFRIIPSNILEAANLVSDYFEMWGIKEWELAGIKSRTAPKSTEAEGDKERSDTERLDKLQSNNRIFIQVYYNGVDVSIKPY